MVNDDSGSSVASEFTMVVTANDPSDNNFPGSNAGTTITIGAGTYFVAETGPSGYSASFSPECVGVANPGDVLTCTLTNDDLPMGTASLRIIKNVVNDDGGTNIPSDFTMVITANDPSDNNFPGSNAGTTITIGAGPYSVTESGPSGYFASFSPECSGVAIPDDVLTCTITNDDKKSSDDNTNGGMNHWDTRPTFGINHETRETMMVDNGFSFNGESFTIIDNHHTAFNQKSINIGTVNTFAATVYASKVLKVQEFLFGVPEIGMGHLAEVRVEVWYDNNGEIEDVKVIQESKVIDVLSLSIFHQKIKCIDTDLEEKCDSTLMSAIFLEPLKDKVMAIKAMDFKFRDQTTYLNDGFDILGESLNPMTTSLIPSTIKYEGLILVTQTEKYSSYWLAEDGRLFEMNRFGSFKQIDKSFERFQDTGNPYTRVHSGFAGIIAYEQKRASGVFDSSELISELPESFAYIFLERDERIDEKMKQQMLIEEQIAKDLLDKKYIQTRW